MPSLNTPNYFRSGFLYISIIWSFRLICYIQHAVDDNYLNLFAFLLFLKTIKSLKQPKMSLEIYYKAILNSIFGKL